MTLIVKQREIIMNEMNQKKLYVWRLATFLHQHGMRMSIEGLAAHLNRNKFLPSYGTEYEGGRGAYTLIKKTYDWIHGELGLQDEAKKVAEVYVKPDGSYAYDE